MRVSSIQIWTASKKRWVLWPEWKARKSLTRDHYRLSLNEKLQRKAFLDKVCKGLIKIWKKFWRAVLRLFSCLEFFSATMFSLMHEVRSSRDRFCYRIQKSVRSLLSDHVALSIRLVLELTGMSREHKHAQICFLIYNYISTMKHRLSCMRNVHPGFVKYRHRSHSSTEPTLQPDENKKQHGLSARRCIEFNEISRFIWKLGWSFFS